MIGDISSQGSSLVSEERSLVLHLILTTFAGEEIQLSIELQELDRLNEFENAVLENLAFLVSAMSIHESLLLFPTDLYIPWPPAYMMMPFANPGYLLQRIRRIASFANLTSLTEI